MDVQRTGSADWAGEAALGSAAARSGVTAAVGSGVRFVVQFGGAVVIARLLGPAEYGFAVVTVVVVGLADLLRTGGVATVITRDRTLSDGAVAGLHRVSIVVGALLSTVAVLLAAVLARSTGFASATIPLAVLGLVFVIAGVSAVPGALLARNLRFRPLVLVEASGMALGVLAGSVTALGGGGARALVVQAVVAAAATGVGIVWVCPWRPGRAESLRSVGSALGFSASTSFVQVVTFCSRNVDRVLAGIVGGSAVAGLYAQASQLLVLPLDQFGGALQRVAVPVFARVDDDTGRFRRLYRRLVMLLCAVLWPVFASLAVLAPDLLEVLVGAEWVPAATIFRILAVAGLAQAAGYVSTWVFTATGQATRQLTWTLVSRPVVVAACAIGASWGAHGVALAGALAAVALVVPGFLAAGRGVGLGIGDLLRPLAAPAVLTVAVGSATSGVTALLADAPAVVTVLLGAVVSTVVWCAVTSVVPATRREFRLVVALLRQRQTGAFMADSSAAVR